MKLRAFGTGEVGCIFTAGTTGSLRAGRLSGEVIQPSFFMDLIQKKNPWLYLFDPSGNCTFSGSALRSGNAFLRIRFLRPVVSTGSTGYETTASIQAY